MPANSLKDVKQKSRWVLCIAGFSSINLFGVGSPLLLNIHKLETSKGKQRGPLKTLAQYECAVYFALFILILSVFIAFSLRRVALHDPVGRLHRRERDLAGTSFGDCFKQIRCNC